MTLFTLTLFTLCSLSVPAAIRPDGLPFGVCFVADALQDAMLAHLGSQWQRSTQLALGYHGYRQSQKI